MPTLLLAGAIAGARAAINYTVGYALSPSTQPPAIDNARQFNNRVQSSRYGMMIPRIYGTVEFSGAVIWATDFRDDVTVIRGTRSKRGGTPDQINHTPRRSFGILVCAVPEGGSIAGVRRIKFNDETFADAGAGLLATSASNYEIKLGGADQTPNTWYEAYKGVGRVSAHRGYLTLWFHDIDCGPYGDMLPNVRVEVVQSTDPTLQSVVEAECRVAKLLPADFDASELSGQTVSGYFVNSLGPVRASLEQLSAAFLFDGSEYDGKIHFRTRPRSASATVAWDELGAVEEEDGADEDEPTPRLSEKRVQAADIASEVHVLYFSKGRDYEGGSQPFRRQNLQGGSTATHSYNVVMTDAEALRLAKIKAVAGWAERTPVELSLPPEFFVYAAGDVLKVPTSEDETDFIDVRIEKFSFSTPGVVRVTGRRQYAEAYDQAVEEEEGTPGESPPLPLPVEVPCPTDIWIDDRPPWRWEDRGTFGHTIGVRPTGCAPEGGTWRGVSVLRDVDGAGDMRQHAVITEAATMGVTASVLGAAPVGDIDTVNHVDIDLGSDAVASITNEAFEADRTLGLWAIGGETLQARDVEDLGGGVYRLSHLRRKLFGTTDEGHAMGQRAVLLDGRVVRVTHNKEEVGKSFDFYPVTFKDSLENTSATSFTYGARGVEDGGDVPSEVQDAGVAPLNGQNILQWQPPLENTNTLRGYRVEVFSDPAMTVPVAGFENVEVRGNQMVMPGVEAL